ncbi:hypothetical protein HMPREF9392_0417 [Streptococcus sanguinis SK678]|nr:hypothetical protein HMPREF9392_0417 [Streptococcus sanguinis SK678]
MIPPLKKFTGHYNIRILQYDERDVTTTPNPFPDDLLLKRQKERASVLSNLPEKSF